MGTMGVQSQKFEKSGKIEFFQRIFFVYIFLKFLAIIGVQ